MVAALCWQDGLKAQPLVDIGLFQKGADTLEVKLVPKGNFSGVVSNVVFAIRWESGCNVNLGSVVQSAQAASYIPVSKSGSQQSSSGYTYQIFGGAGMTPMSSAGASWFNGVAVTVMKIKVSNPRGFFEIKNDTWTGTSNGNYFVSLNGQNKTGVIYNPQFWFTTSRSVSICQGQSILLGGASRTTAGTYYDTLQAAGGCDSLVRTVLTIKPSFTRNIAVAICQGQSYFAGGQWRTVSGTYTDAYVASNGCDSSIIITLSVYPKYSTTRAVSICQGESYYAGGALRTTSGVYTDSFTTSHGCDSVIATTLTVYPTYFKNISASICDGGSYLVGGIYRTQSGTYYDTLSSRRGCDSVVAVALTVKPKFITSFSHAICQGSSYLFAGTPRTVAGTYQALFTARNGCDSLVTLTLTVNPKYNISRSVSICSGSSYFAAGAWRTTSGTYTDFFLTSKGCDSTVVTTLTVLPSIVTNRAVSACAGQSVFAGGALRTSSGTYYDTLTASGGCDSVIATVLTFYNVIVTQRDVQICSGGSYFAGGANRTTPGTYYDTLVSSHNCDSVIATNLYVLPVFSTVKNVAICQGGSYLFAGVPRTTAGTYVATFTARNGCDSVVTLNLAVNPKYNISRPVSICSGDRYYAGGAWRTTAGTYYDYLLTSKGCDSTIATQLTIRPVITASRNVSACAGQPVFAGGAPQTVSGTYYDTLVAANGCDSIVATNLTFYSSVITHRDVQICAGAGFFAGGAFRTTAGTYYDTLTSSHQCDSVVATHLYILPTYSTIRNVSICQGQSYFAGGAFRTVSGAYNDRFTARNGCDSIVTTNLTVKPVFSTSVSVSICQGESYFAGGQWRTTTGVYQNRLTASNGCDSVVTVNLTVRPEYLVNRNISICQGDSLFVGGKYRSQPGAYSDSLQTAYGCDSVVVVNLNVLSTIITNRVVSLCAGENYFAGGAYQTSDGVYYDTLRSAGSCDSVVITALTFHETDTTIIDVLIHAGDSYYAGGAYQTTSGNYYDTFQNASGCDSLVITVLSAENIVSDLVVNKIVNTFTIRTTLEKDYADNTYGTNAVGWPVNRTLDSLIVSDRIQWALYDAEGQKKMDFKVDYFSNSALSPSGYESLGVNGGEGQVIEGSDTSILRTTTSINENFNSYGYVLPSASPATDSNYTPNPAYPDWIYDVWYEATVKLNVFGNSRFGYFDLVEAHASPDKDDTYLEHEPDSIIPPSCPRKIVAKVIICESDSYFVGGAWQTLPGTYFDTLASADSCDIVVISNLVVEPLTVTNNIVSICAGESYVAGGAAQTVSGIYYDTIDVPNACDSVIITKLTVYPNRLSSRNVSICAGNSILVGGVLRTTPGIYYDTLVSANGCDSIVATTLSVQQAILQQVSATACAGNSYYAGGNFQTVSGVYYDTLTAAGGCDSIVMTTLTFYNATTTHRDVQICAGASFFAGGMNRTAAGTYFDTLLSSNQCDSILVTHLYVLPVYNTVRNVSICQGQSFFAGGALRTVSGTYSDRYTARNGCDSTVLTNLTVKPVFVKHNNISICQGQRYFAGGAWRTATGTYQDVLTAANGCDSTVFTHLVVIQPKYSTLQFALCEGDSVYFAGVFRKESGLYHDTLTAASGCDSIVIASVMIQLNVTLVRTVSICEGESYFAGGAFQTVTGEYNDTFAGALCDSVVVTSLVVVKPETQVVNVSICGNESYFAGGRWRTSSGVYYDTLTAASGCDSIRITDLTVKPVYSKTFFTEICSGESVPVGNHIYSVSGVYRDTFTARNGCDSIIVTNLSVHPAYADTLAVQICNDQTYFAQGANRNTSGTYRDTFETADGCDSVIVTMLTVVPAYSRTQRIEICSNESYFAGGRLRTATGVYRDTFSSAGGCDSIVITDLKVYPVYFRKTDVYACSGDSVFVGGDYQTIPGIYFDTLSSRHGCDSVVRTNFVIMPDIEVNLDVAICSGDSFDLGGTYYNSPGFYQAIFLAHGGCDSVVNVNLSVVNGYLTNTALSICSNDSVFLGGAYQSSAGIYTDTFYTAAGCDSVVITNLSVLQSYSHTIQTSICDDEKIFAQGAWRSTSGTYYDHFTARNGCDSLIVTQLTVHPTYHITKNVSICQGESYFAGGANRTTAGTYTDSYQTAAGCDSIVVTNLTVLPKRSKYNPVMICRGQSYFAGGSYRTTNGIFFDTLTAGNGCDSIVLTILQVLPPVIKNNYVNICNGESYFAGGQFRTVSGVYYDTLVTSRGCDSIIITTLFIKEAFYKSRTITICDDENYFAGGAYRNTTGLYYDTFTARNGCDSVLATYLIVNERKFFNRSVTICSGENFYAGGAFQTITGTYYDTLIARNGCDSIIITELEALPSYSENRQVTICASENYFAGGASQNTSGTYYDSLLAANGCDSVIVTELTVLPVYHISRTENICSGDSVWADGAYRGVSGVFVENHITERGCDSVVTITVNVAPVFAITNNITVCSGEAYFAGGAWQSITGIYYDTFTTRNGCDSSVVTNLLVKNNGFGLITVTICNGENYFAGGALQTTAGNYFDTLVAANGCDSVVLTKLRVLPSYFIPVQAVICNGESYFAGGANQAAGGIYFDTLNTSLGCDSIIETELTILTEYNVSNAITICRGDSVWLAGRFRNISGVYIDSLLSVSGCDSVVTTTLTVLPDYSSNNQVQICEGSGYFAQGMLQTVSGIYYDTLTAANGCDSVIVTQLTILPKQTTVLDITVCDGEGVFAGGSIRTVSGVYSDTFWGANGCDSTVITNLTVIPVSVDTVAVTLCEGESYFAQGANQFVEGFFFDTLANRNGCDSVIVTNLRVNPVYAEDRFAAVCQGESYFAGGALQSASGTYADTFISAAGCDSIVVTHLTVNPKYYNVQFVSLCAGDSVYAGGAYRKLTGTYSDSLVSINGCDSVIVTELTVLPVFSFVNAVGICNGESYFAGNALRSSTGTYYDTLAARNGCDSVIITQLSVRDTFITSLNISICEGENYFAGGSSRSLSGTYFDTLQNALGCDSVLVTNLSVIARKYATVNTTICGSDSIYLQGAFQDTTGTYFDTVTAASGCDSVITTNLTVLPVFTAQQYFTICEGDSILLGGAYRVTSGGYTDVYLAENGCPGFLYSSLTVLAASRTDRTVSICSGDSVMIAGAYRSAAGAFTDTLVAANGCDSIVTTTLAVYPSVTADAGQDKVICEGETVTLEATGGTTFQWSNGMAGASFAVSPPATQTFAVTVSNSSGCSGTDEVLVTVNRNPVVSFSGLGAAYCSNEQPALLSGMPAGGTFSGTGINGNSFVPSAAAPGNHTVSYSYTNANGCSASAAQQVTVFAVPAATFSGLDSLYCIEDKNVQLTGIPAGGVFSGDGISADSFNSQHAGAGIHLIRYAFVTSDGCVAADTQMTNVLALPASNFELADTEFCISDSPVALNGLPEGGIYSGNGVNGSEFYPNQSGAGVKALSYLYTDSNGCSSLKTIQVRVRNLPLTEITGLAPAYCVNQGNINLTGSPQGGTFAGGSVLNNTFIISSAGLGSHSVFYSYVDSHGCANTDTAVISVYKQPMVALSGLAPEYCENADPVYLTGTPAGGSFSGRGMVVNVFDPELAGLGGPFPVLYTYNDPSGCTATDSQWVTINPLPKLNLDRVDFSYCLEGQPVELPAEPSGGVFSGPGISNNHFLPAQAGLGNHEVIYTYTDTNNCSANIVATVLVELCSGVSNSDLTGNVLAYPNPFSETIHLDVEYPKHADLRLRLFDVLGRTILLKTVQIDNGVNSIEIRQLNHLAPGIYYLEVSTDEMEEQFKLLKP